MFETKQIAGAGCQRLRTQGFVVSQELNRVRARVTVLRDLRSRFRAVLAELRRNRRRIQAEGLFCIPESKTPDDRPGSRRPSFRDVTGDAIDVSQCAKRATDAKRQVDLLKRSIDETEARLRGIDRELETLARQDRQKEALLPQIGDQQAKYGCQ